MKEQVILVDTNDNPQGLMEKMEAHEKGILHRAFSIFIFNSKNELMLQQRAFSKYHTPAYGQTPVAAIPAKAKRLSKLPLAG